MKLDIHKLGVIACALGATSARLPGHAAQDLHLQPAILKLRDHPANIGPPPPPPPPPPPGHHHPPPPPPLDGPGAPPISPHPRNDELPAPSDELQKVHEVCMNDIRRFCDPAPDWGWPVMGQAYVASTKVIMTARRRLLGEAEEAHHPLWHSHAFAAHHHSLRHYDGHMQGLSHQHFLQHAHVGSYPPLGFDPATDACLRMHFDELCTDCRGAIEEFDDAASDISDISDTSEDGTPSEGEPTDPNMPSDATVTGDMLTSSWVHAFVLLGVTVLVFMLAKRRNQRYQAVKTILDTIKGNPELKAVVESTAGVQVPYIKKISPCCFYVGPVILAVFTALSFVCAIFMTTMYVPSEDSEERHHHGAKVVVVCIVALLAFLAIRKLIKARRCHRSISQDGGEGYVYNGANRDGYIALTGTVVESPRPAVSPEHQYYTGIPVNPPGPVAVHASAQAFNPPNVL